MFLWYLKISQHIKNKILTWRCCLQFFPASLFLRFKSSISDDMCVGESRIHVLYISRYLVIYDFGFIL